MQELELHYRQIYAGLRAERIAALQAEILAFDQTKVKQHHRSQLNQKKSKGNWLWVVLVALVIVVVGLFYGRSQYTDTAIANHYFISDRPPNGGKQRRKPAVPAIIRIFLR